MYGTLLHLPSCDVVRVVFAVMLHGPVFQLVLTEGTKGPDENLYIQGWIMILQSTKINGWLLAWKVSTMYKMF